MHNSNDWILDGNRIGKIEQWTPVPLYKKLDIVYVLLLLFRIIKCSREAIYELSFYLKDRKRNNEEYKEFWRNTYNVIFNDDKSEYLYWCYYPTSTKDSKVVEIN